MQMQRKLIKCIAMNSKLNSLYKYYLHGNATPMQIYFIQIEKKEDLCTLKTMLIMNSYARTQIIV